MAFTLSIVRLLARSHARQPLLGPILTLGRQGIYGTLDECAEAIKSAGIVPRPLPPGFLTGPNVPAFNSDVTSKFTNDAAVFQMLCGESPETLDISDYERADHVHDLNDPISEQLKGKFGTIIDGGTLEHIFNAPQALRNLKAMLRPGGRIIHINPMGNWAEHGFYQFSPTLYHDFYVTNGFEMRDCLITETSLAAAESFYRGRSRTWRWSPARPSAAIMSRHFLGIFFEAEKTSEKPDHVPQQGEAARGASSSRLGGVTGQGSFLNRLSAWALKISPAAGSLIVFGKRLLRRDLSSAPWGMTYIGRF